MIKALRDIWETKSEIAQAWHLIAEQGGLDAELDNPIGTIGDALEQITIADLLEMYPTGFAVGPTAGLYQVLRPSGYNKQTDTGTLIVRKMFRIDGA
jgi:hypothetical protein